MDATADVVAGVTAVSSATEPRSAPTPAHSRTPQRATARPFATRERDGRYNLCLCRSRWSQDTSAEGVHQHEARDDRLEVELAGRYYNTRLEAIQALLVDMLESTESP